MSVAIVCGGRDYADAKRVNEVLTDAVMKFGVTVIIQGGASGADRLAKNWCDSKSVHCAQVDAKWISYGNAAGPKRNKAMIELKPDLVIAFPGGKGTANMIKQAKYAGVSVLEIQP